MRQVTTPLPSKDARPFKAGKKLKNVGMGVNEEKKPVRMCPEYRRGMGISIAGIWRGCGFGDRVLHN